MGPWKPPSELPAERSLSIAEFCRTNKIPKPTWDRMRRRRDTPILTWVTPHKAIIRPHHAREWLESKAEHAPGDELSANEN